MDGNLKETTYRLLEGPAEGDLPRQAVIAFLFTLICVSVVIVFLETEKEFSATYGDLLFSITLFAVAVFSVEYLLRVWVCTRNSSPLKAMPAATAACNCCW